MLLFKEVGPLRHYLNSERKAGKTIGFSPTMGALHEGHLSLIRQSQQKSDISVCSIFVNPTQFNDPEDLKKYPRTESRDIRLLAGAACQVLFMPGVEEMYPKNGSDNSLELDLGRLDKVMEGAFRPGHFNGVAQVVKRLLDIVSPDFLFMGQKDFQQFTIIQHLIDQLKLPVELVVCPIIREADGLAMSSRNVRLSDRGRQKATAIFKALESLQAGLNQRPVEELKKTANHILLDAGLEPEYVEIVDGRTLQPVVRSDDANYLVACIAAWMDQVRLIDNKILKTPRF